MNAFLLVDLNRRVRLAAFLGDCADGHWLQRWPHARGWHLRNVIFSKPGDGCRDMARAVAALAAAHADAALRADRVRVANTCFDQRFKIELPPLFAATDTRFGGREFIEPGSDLIDAVQRPNEAVDWLNKKGRRIIGNLPS